MILDFQRITYQVYIWKKDVSKYVSFVVQLALATSQF